MAPPWELAGPNRPLATVTRVPPVSEAASRPAFEVLGFGEQQVRGMSQPRGTVDDKLRLERYALDRQHTCQIAQELRGIDIANA